MNLLVSTSSTLRAFIISPAADLTAAFRCTADEIDGFEIARVISDYPSASDLARLIRIYLPHVVFIDGQSLTDFAKLYGAVRSELPSIRVAALHNNCEPEILLALMRMGVQECLTAPFADHALRDYLARVTGQLRDNPIAFHGTDLVYSFLPAKPGVGATTLAVNAALAAARMLGSPAFLGDFDLNCGLVRLMLKLSNDSTTVDAAARSIELDEQLWPQMISSVQGVDVIHAGQPKPDTRIDMLGMRRLLAFVRRMYKIACYDLSGNLEKYSIEIMRESKRIFLVTTPELPALHLAREKRQFLDSIDLGDRVTLLLNRSTKTDTLTANQIEQLVGGFAHVSFPNDYASVHDALSAGTGIRYGSTLAAQFTTLARYMVDGKLPVEASPKKRFVEYFSLVPTTFCLQRQR